MLEIKNITKMFGDKGIKNITFNLEKGNIIGFVGDNGAGKSTLIKCIFNEYKKDSGEVLLDNQSLYENGNLKYLSFFPDQSIYPKGVTIKDYCLHDSELAGINAKEAEKKLDDLLKKFELFEYKNKTFNKLSAGMQKKVLLIICLVSNPSYIFLDEPTANLDVHSRKDFLEILKLLALNGVGILITSHIIDELQEVINKLILINNGQIVYNENFNWKKQKIIDLYLKFNSDYKKIDYKDFIKSK